MKTVSTCKICGDESRYCFDALLLRKYKVSYYRCINCGFIQTESPYWLDEAYDSAITNEDIGLVYRNLLITPILSSLIAFCYNKNGEFLDYGGGYGLLTRIMRDKGFRYYRFDTYCDNLFAKNFDRSVPDVNGAVYELLSAFEVFEHLNDPVNELEKMLKWSTNIFFSTELQPDRLNSANDWWYVMPETGQHIAFYTIKSLRLLGEKYGLNFYSNGINLHLFTKKEISPFLFKVIMIHKYAKVLNMFSKKNQSLLMKDYNQMKQLNIK